MKLPAMAGGASSSAKSDADIKAAARAKARGKNAYVDAFFEYLSDAFRPLLPVLLGASLILAFLAVLEACGVVDTHAKTIPTWLGYVNSMWRAVFYFLPAMVAYNASKKLDIDPWVGTAVILSLLTPNFTGLTNTKNFASTTCIQLVKGRDDMLQCTAHIENVPLIGTLSPASARLRRTGVRAADHGADPGGRLQGTKEDHPRERPDGVRPLRLLRHYHAADGLPDRPPVDLDR